MFWCFNKASNIDRKETHIYKEKADRRCLVFSTTFNKKLSSIIQCFDVLIRPRTLTVKKHLYTKEKADTKCLVFSTTFNQKLSNIRQCFDVLIRPRTLTVKKPIYTRRKLLQNVLSFPQLSIKSYQILGNVLMFNKASNIDRKETHIYQEKADTKCLVFSTTFNKKLSNIRQWFDVLIRHRTLTVKKPIYTRRKLIQDVLSFPQLSIKNYQILGNDLRF